MFDTAEIVRRNNGAGHVDRCDGSRRNGKNNPRLRIKRKSKILYAYRRDTLFRKINDGREAAYPVVISRQELRGFYYSKSAASVKKQPSVSYYKSAADVSVI